MLNKTDISEIEISGAVKAILLSYSNVIGEAQARNIAYAALDGARTARFEALRDRRPAPGHYDSQGNPPWPIRY